MNEASRDLEMLQFNDFREKIKIAQTLKAYNNGDVNFNRRKGSIFVAFWIGMRKRYSIHVEREVVHEYSKKVPE